MSNQNLNFEKEKHKSDSLTNNTMGPPTSSWIGPALHKKMQADPNHPSPSPTNSRSPSSEAEGKPKAFYEALETQHHVFGVGDVAHSESLDPDVKYTGRIIALYETGKGDMKAKLQWLYDPRDVLEKKNHLALVGEHEMFLSNDVYYVSVNTLIEPVRVKITYVSDDMYIPKTFVTGLYVDKKSPLAEELLRKRAAWVYEVKRMYNPVEKMLDKLTLEIINNMEPPFVKLVESYIQDTPLKAENQQPKETAGKKASKRLLSQMTDEEESMEDDTSEIPEPDEEKFAKKPRIVIVEKKGNQSSLRKASANALTTTLPATNTITTATTTTVIAPVSTTTAMPTTRKQSNDSDFEESEHEEAQEGALEKSDHRHHHEEEEANVAAVAHVEKKLEKAKARKSLSRNESLWRFFQILKFQINADIALELIGFLVLCSKLWSAGVNPQIALPPLIANRARDIAKVSNPFFNAICDELNLKNTDALTSIMSTNMAWLERTFSELERMRPGTIFRVLGQSIDPANWCFPTRNVPIFGSLLGFDGFQACKISYMKQPMMVPISKEFEDPMGAAVAGFAKLVSSEFSFNLIRVGDMEYEVAPSPDETGEQIFITSITGKTFEVQIPIEKALISFVKCLIQDQCAIPVQKMQFFIMAGSNLDSNTLTLAQMHVTPSSSLNLVSRTGG